MNRTSLRIGLLVLSLALTVFALVPPPAVAQECPFEGASEWRDEGCCSNGGLLFRRWICDGTYWQPTTTIKCSFPGC